MRLILCFATLVLSSFNFNEYQGFLASFGLEHFGLDTQLYYSPGQWKTTKQDGKNLFFASVPENCPAPTYGVTLWDPPQDEVYGKKCMAILSETNTRKQLLEAMRPPIQGYPPIRGYHHVTLNVTTFLTRGDNEFIFETQLQKMNKSKLLDHASLVVRIGLLDERVNQTLTDCVKKIIQNRIEEFAIGAKIEWVNPSLYECGTISSLKLFCLRNKGSLVFYLHNKGISRISEANNYLKVKYWREYMMFYLVERWNLCANVLTHGAATCGVKLAKKYYKHYSGNFWWSSCEHVLNNRNPCPFGRALRHAAEFWLISDPTTLKDQPAVELWSGLSADYKHYYRRNEYNCVDQLISNHSWRLTN